MNFMFVLSQADEGADKANVAYFPCDFCNESNHNKRSARNFYTNYQRFVSVSPLLATCSESCPSRFLCNFAVDTGYYLSARFLGSLSSKQREKLPLAFVGLELVSVIRRGELLNPRTL